MSVPIQSSTGLTLLPVDCFAAVAGRPGAVWLDSSLTRSGWGDLSLMATDPVEELRISFHELDYGRLNGVMRELERIRTGRDRYAIGYISYEATLSFLGLPVPLDSSLEPAVHFYVYDRVLKYDHRLEQYSDHDLAVQFLEESTLADPTAGHFGNTSTRAVVEKKEYLDKVRLVKEYIREGEIYQGNLTCRFDIASRLSPFAAYLRLRRLNPATYAAYLNFGDYQVLSSSPERMFRWDGDLITSSPIKGTIPRGDCPETDRGNRMRLQGSVKDRAELLMIVDLVRNDLGKVARTGSVTVDELYRLETLSSLHHLVADISARTRRGTTLNDVLSALLPGGSITGAPKRRAVELLLGLEDTPRHVYTGCIGYVGNGRADFNIAIRTLMHHNGTYRVHAGGGIVADSDPEAEYDEMQHKARNLLRAVEETG